MSILDVLDINKVDVREYKSELWFKHADICRELGLTNPSYERTRLNQKGVIRLGTGTQTPPAVYIDKKNLCRLLIRVSAIMEGRAIELLCDNLDFKESSIKIGSVRPIKQKSSNRMQGIVI